MSAPQSRLASLGTQPPLALAAPSSSSEDLEAPEIQFDHRLLLQDTIYTKDTVAASQYPTVNEKEAEKGSPVGFWDQKLNNVRWHVLMLWARTVAYSTIFIFCVLALFNGVFYHTIQNYSSLIVYVVDFDGQVSPYQGGQPVVGPAIVQAIIAMANSDPPQMRYTTMTPSQFNNDPIAVRRAVYDFKAHAAIIINANATALLQQAVEQGNSTYDPNGAAQIIYVSARDQNTIPTYVVPQLTHLEMAVTSQFGAAWTKSLLQNTTIPRANLTTVPQALSPAIGFTTFDLRPFGPANVIPAVSLGLIYLIIVAFFSFTFFLPIHMKFLSPRGHPPLHFHHLIIWRWLATTGLYFFLSLSYSFVVLAFQVPFSNRPASPTEPAINPSAYGKATFFVYWMVHFLGMSALGLACENVAMTLGNPWVAMWLVFWVISNVATGFYSLDLAPAFYLWGYAWPLHNLVEASHQLLFDLHSRIGLHVSVLAIWFVINTILFAPACYLMRWSQQRAGKKVVKKEKDWLQAMSRQRSRLGIPKKTPLGEALVPEHLQG